MSSARYNEGKPQWLMLMDYFPNAMKAILDARMYAINKYTDPDKGLDGRTNFLECLKDPEEAIEFIQGCREAGERHLLKEAWEGPDDETQDGIPHAAFEALNTLIRMELRFRLEEQNRH